MDNLLHPSVASVQSYGACGVFQSDIPPLPQPRREFAAAMLGEDLVLVHRNVIIQNYTVS